METFILLLLVLFLILTFISTYWYWCIYYYFSGLHKLSGPPKYIPFFGDSFRVTANKDIVINLHKIGRKYNDVALLMVGFLPLVAVSDPKMAEFIMKLPNTKKGKLSLFLKRWLIDSLVLSTGIETKQRRIYIMKGLPNKTVDGYVQIFNQQSDKLLSNLEEAAKHSQYVNVHNQMNYIALDTMTESVLSTNPHSLEGQNKGCIDALHRFTKIFMDRVFKPWKHPEWIFQLTRNFRDEKNCVKVLHGVTNSIISSRRNQLKNGSHMDLNSKSYIDLLIETRLNGQLLTDKYLLEEVENIKFAGHSVSSALCYGLYAIANDARVQQKILAEQRQIFSDDFHRAVTADDLSRMDYLDHVFKEILRMYPPGPATGREILEDIEYDGMLFKKGTHFIINIFGLHRNGKFFPNPDVFYPERFAENSDLDTMKYGYIPFGYGPRNCLGRRYAERIVKTVLSKMIRHFDLGPSPQGHQLGCVQELFLNSDTGFPITLTRRKI